MNQIKAIEVIQEMLDCGRVIQAVVELRKYAPQITLMQAKTAIDAVRFDGRTVTSIVQELAPPLTSIELMTEAVRTLRKVRDGVLPSYLLPDLEICLAQELLKVHMGDK